MLKKSLALLSMAFSITVLFLGLAHAQEIQIINGTDFPIYKVTLCDTGTGDLDGDILDGEILQPNEALSLEISGESSGWDLAATDDENQKLILRNLDFTNADRIILHSDGSARLE